MTPYEEAFKLMRSRGYDAEAILELYLKKGFVYVDPECCILAHWDTDRLFVWLAIGRQCLKRFCEIAPKGLQRVSFQRGLRGHETPRTYDFDRFRRLCALNPNVQAL